MQQLVLDLLTCGQWSHESKAASYACMQEKGGVAGEWVGVGIRDGQRGPGMGGNRRSASHIDCHIA